MHGTFWFGYDFQDLIFSGLNISTGSGFLLACACVFGIAFFYETQKICLALIKLNSAIFITSKGQYCISDELVIEKKKPFQSRRFVWLISEMGIYTTEAIFGYLIMLLIMTYNLYFIITILFASALCYSLFGQRIYEIKMKTSKLKLTCTDCTKQKKCSSSSSTEAVTESMTDMNVIYTNPPLTSGDISQTP